MIVHRAGTKMKQVNALSCNLIMVIQKNNIMLNLRKAQDEDEYLKAIITILEGDKPYDDYIIQQNTLHKICNGIELIVVPRKMERNNKKST